MVSQDDELYNRHNATSIFIMALDAIRKAVGFHHTRISPGQIEMMDDLKQSICTKMRDYPGGTLAIRARNIILDSAPGLETDVVYRVPAAPGSRREEREKRRREKREARRQAGRERGDYLNTLTFFGYNTDASDDEEVTSTVNGSPSDAPRRKKRVRRSLIRRISYYPPRSSNEGRQVVLHFMNLEKDGADFTAPINGEEFRQGNDDGGDTSGMDSDFDDSNDPLPIPQEPYEPSAPSSVVGDGGDHPFSPTTATTHLVQSLSVTDRYPLALPPGDTVWTLGFASLAGAAPIVPDADAAAAAMWQATEAAWDTVPDQSPFVPQPTAQAPPPWPTSPEPATGGMPANAIFDLNAAAASLMRQAPTPPPTIIPVASVQQQQLVNGLCGAMSTSGSTPAHVVAAYLTEREAPGSQTGYASLRLPSERDSFRQLHAIIERTIEIMARQAVSTVASQLVPSSPAPPAPPASAPPSLAPGGPSSTRVNVINLPGLGTHRIEQNGGGLPPTFTSRGRMKRQREAQAATAAVIAEAHAAAAAHAAREQQGDDTLVAGPSVSFDHDRRKARRLVDESPSSPCTPAPATSAPPAEDVPSATQSLQRVLGAVVQHPSSAAAAATASVHSSSCPCVYCPQAITNRPRTGIQALAPPGSQNILGQPPLPPLSQAEADQQRRHQAHQLLIAQIQAQQQQQQLQHRALAMLQHPPPPPPPPSQQAQQQHPTQQLLQLLHQQQRYVQSLAAPTPAALTPQSIIDRQVVNTHRPGLPLANIGAPTLPRMDLPFYYSPMSFLSVAQPAAAMPPPSFVDLPDANQVMSRQHMFNPGASSLTTAAAAALAVARTEVRQGAEQAQTDHLLQHWMSLNEANQQFHALRQYLTGIPGGGEAAPIGAAQRDIDKYSVTQKWRAVEGADVDPCTVCMNEFEEGENVRKLTCNHAFHVHCIDPWLSYNKKCPNCRIDLDQAASAGTVAAPPAAPAAPAAASPAAESIDDQLSRVTRSLHAAAQQQLLNEMTIQQQNEAFVTAAAESETRFATGLNTAPTTGPVMANVEL